MSVPHHEKSSRERLAGQKNPALQQDRRDAICVSNKDVGKYINVIR